MIHITRRLLLTTLCTALTVTTAWCGTLTTPSCGNSIAATCVNGSPTCGVSVNPAVCATEETAVCGKVRHTNSQTILTTGPVCLPNNPPCNFDIKIGDPCQKITICYALDAECRNGAINSCQDPYVITRIDSSKTTKQEYRCFYDPKNCPAGYEKYLLNDMPVCLAVEATPAN
jgi:hypothetical protein